MSSPARRRRPRQARAQATVDAIIEASAQVLLSEGYGGLSTNHVATRSGVSIGTLYQYFSNKDALIGALIDRELERHFGIIAPSLLQHSEAPLEVGVRAYVQATMARHATEGELVRALFDQADRVGHSRLTALWLARIEPLTEAAIRAQGIALPDPALSAAILCRAVHHCVEMAVRDRRALLADPRFVDELVCLICSFLQAPRALADRATP